MDWIKKHYEKIILALALLLVIASAAVLSLNVGRLSEEVLNAPRQPKPKGKGVQPMDFGAYSNALVAVQQPPLWTNKEHWTFTQGPGEKQPTTQVSTNVANLPALVRVDHVPFNLLFLAYSGDGHNFQLNFLTRAQTFMVSDVGDEVGNRFYKTGYMTKKFEIKKTQANIGGSLREVDVSELTLQHQGEDPIVLVHGQIKEGREPVAWVVCPGSARMLDVRRDLLFSCGDATYNVIDITPKQMIIINQKSEEKLTIPLSVPKQ